MMAAIERLKGKGWEAEGNADYGFVFIRNGDERRLADANGARSVLVRVAIILAVSILAMSVCPPSDPKETMASGTCEAMNLSPSPLTTHHPA
jgi:hypothetical protein